MERFHWYYLLDPLQLLGVVAVALLEAALLAVPLIIAYRLLRGLCEAIFAMRDWEQ